MSDNSNNVFNNKYSKALTVVLIIVIIGVVVLLGFLGYDVYRKYDIETGSKDAVEKFEDQLANKLANTNTEPELPTDSIVNAIDPDVDLNTIQNTTGGSNGEQDEDKVTYKGFEVIGTIKIPKTDIEYPIIRQEDVSINSLDVAICNLYGKLNEPGSNAVLVGHNYRNGTFFSNNKRLSNGDKIYITDNSGERVTYVVYKKYETGTGDFDYATREIEEGKREISLSTCTDDTSRRLIIWAREE